jgi:hypothetical protein
LSQNPQRFTKVGTSFGPEKSTSVFQSSINPSIFIAIEIPAYSLPVGYLPLLILLLIWDRGVAAMLGNRLPEMEVDARHGAQQAVFA